MIDRSSCGLKCSPSCQSSKACPLPGGASDPHPTCIVPTHTWNVVCYHTHYHPYAFVGDVRNTCRQRCTLESSVSHPPARSQNLTLSLISSKPSPGVRTYVARPQASSSDSLILKMRPIAIIDNTTADEWSSMASLEISNLACDDERTHALAVRRLGAVPTNDGMIDCNMRTSWMRLPCCAHVMGCKRLCRNHDNHDPGVPCCSSVVDWRWWIGPLGRSSSETDRTLHSKATFEPTLRKLNDPEQNVRTRYTSDEQRSKQKVINIIRLKCS